MNDIFSYSFVAVTGLILLAMIARQPFLGIVFMVCMLPLDLFAALPGALRGVTSVTSLFGLAALVFSTAKNSRFFSEAKTSDKYVYIFTGFLYLVIIIGEIFKPISTGIIYPFSYLQLLILMWLSEQIFKTSEQLETLMKFFIATNIIAAIMSISNFSIIPSDDDISRLSGLQGNANEFAVYLSIAIIMVFYFIMRASSTRARIFLAIIAAGLLFPLLLSGSRGAILFLILILAWLFLQFRKGNLILVVFVLMVFVIAIGVLGPYLPQEYFQRIANIPQDILYGNDTVGLREGLWQYGLELWSKQPILGIGSGLYVKYSIFSPILHGTRMLELHNTYLTYLVENGILGLFFFLLLIVRAIINYSRVIRSAGANSTIRILAIVMQAVMFFILLDGVKGNLNTNKFLWFSFAISMIVVSLQNTASVEIAPNSMKNTNFSKSYRIR